MRDWRFSCRGSLARQKEVSPWILLMNWFDLNHHFRGVFLLLEHLWVHLFCFSFHVEECIIGERMHFRPNTCAIKIYNFISTRLASLIFDSSCCCYIYCKSLEVDFVKFILKYKQRKWKLILFILFCYPFCNAILIYYLFVLILIWKGNCSSISEI